MAQKKAVQKSTLNNIKTTINKAHGDGAIAALDVDTELERLPTGVLALDRILGGGLPYGKMVELFGPHGSGKTAIAMRIIAEAQKRGAAVLVDLESAFDPHMADNSGVDMSALLISQPETAEQTLEIINSLLFAQEVSVIVVDSVAGMVPSAEIAGDFGDAHVGLQARLMSQGLRKLAATQRSEGANKNIIIVWINQIREKIGMQGYGPKTDTTGGRALKFWCSTRIDVARIEAVKGSESDDPIGHKVRIKNVKSRFSPPYQMETFDILYETGISNEGTLLDMAVDAGLVDVAGSWFTNTLTGEKSQGRQKVLKLLREDADSYSLLLETVKESTS